jgi:hypothetical protein
MEAKRPLMEKVYARDGKRCGKVCWYARPCQLAGCNGVRLMVRWKDGKVTYPCTKGMKIRKDGHWQIM